MIPLTARGENDSMKEAVSILGATVGATGATGAADFMPGKISKLKFILEEKTVKASKMIPPAAGGDFDSMDEAVGISGATAGATGATGAPEFFPGEKYLSTLQSARHRDKMEKMLLIKKSKIQEFPACSK